MRDDEHAVRVTIRHRGRRYEAEAYPNGSTAISRDGVWLANANWNGRTLECGDHELHADLDESNAIIAALAAALDEAAPDLRRDPRTRG